MNKQWQNILIVAILFVACSNLVTYDEKASIKGILQNTSNNKLLLQKLTSKEVVFLDSTRTDKEGKFSFSYIPTEAGYYRITESDNNFFNFIIMPNEKVDISGDISKLALTYDVQGSAESKRLKLFNEQIAKFYLKNDSLNSAMKNHQSTSNFTAIPALQVAQQQLNTDYYNYIKQFITDNPSSLTALAAVQKLSMENDIEYYVKVEEGLKSIIPNSSIYKEFSAAVGENKKLAPGFQAPEIILNDPNGTPVSLSSLKGKVVLIDFWASWCGPCRKENPNVVKVYNKYKDKGFEILGVSLDNNKQAWLGAIEKDGLTWKHISDLKGWQSSIAPIYKVTSIPMTYLIDKEGKIIAKNLRGEALSNKLEELFR